MRTVGSHGDDVNDQRDEARPRGPPPKVRPPGRWHREEIDVAAESLAAQLRQKRSEMMVSEVAGVALRLFEERGFDAVTVDEVAASAQISVRTFYRCFPA